MKIVFFLTLIEKGLGRVPGRVFGALAASKEALGKVDQVQGGSFWRALDRQMFVRAQLLIEKVGGF